MNFSVSHIHILQNSPPTPPYLDFRAGQEARAKLLRGSYEGQGPNKHLIPHQGGPGQGTSKIPVLQKRGKAKHPPVHQGGPGQGQTFAKRPTKIPVMHKGGPGQGTNRCLPPQKRGSMLGSQPLFSGGFRPPVRPPTGSLVATINLLSKRK